MKKLLLFLFVLSIASVSGQKKSELLAQIQGLRIELDSVQGLVSDAQRGERLNVAKAEALQTQVGELQDANATLLKNLNSFATVSSKNSDNINKAMASLQAKERQLRVINDALARNDSTALIVLTNAKQTLGENAKIGVSNGAVVISAGLSNLFGSDSGNTIVAEAEAWVQKIGQVLLANPKMNVTVEGLSMTGNLDLPAQQAAAVGSALQRLEVTPERITTLGKDGNLKEGVIIKIHPNYNEFYSMVKEQMKN